MKGCLIAGLRIIGGIVVGAVLGFVLALVAVVVISPDPKGMGGVGWFMVFIPLGALLGGIRGVIVTARVWRQTARP